LKATKTLQTKEKLIATLKESAASTNSDSSERQEGSASLRLIEIDELKGERDYLREELNSKNSSLELLRAEMMVIFIYIVFKKYSSFAIINYRILFKRNLSHRVQSKSKRSKIN
jgi:hypothetical protein